MLQRGEPRTGGRAGPSVHEAEAPAAWHGLCVFVVPERSAALMDEVVKGIERGLEILAVVPLDARARAAVAARLPPGRPALPTRRPAGDPHSLVIACDVMTAPGLPTASLGTDARVAAVADYTTKRVLGHLPPADAHEVVRHTVGPQQALDLVELLDDPPLQSRLLVSVHELGRACAMPFPVVATLGGDSPGFRSRVGVVDHPRHGRSVCKIFRPGAAAAFRRELHARVALADQPLTPRLLEHGPNWLLTPVYGDDGSHRLRRLPGFPDMHQLRPEATRALARYVRVLHERGLFVLDLSPHNLVTDPDAGLKVLDLEFVHPYAAFGPVPPAAGAWSYRGVPAALRTIDLPVLPLTRGVGNSVFHPAIAGLPVERLLDGPRRGDGVRRATTQVGWWLTTATIGRVHAAVRRRAR